MMEFFAKNSHQLSAVNFFRKKPQLEMIYDII